MAVALAGGLWIGARSDFSPLGLLSAPVALVLLWLGALWRRVGGERVLVLAGLVVSVLALMLYRPVPLNMKVGDYGIPLISLALAVAMSLGLCAVARALAGWRVLVFLGRRSLTLMYCHVAVIHYGTPYMGKAGLLVLAVLLPLMVHEALARTTWGRRYFLGMRERAGAESAPK